MLSVTKEEIGARIESDNLWWAPEDFAIPESAFRRRTYFEPFQKLALNFDVRRATILLGPRRVGKTVMLMQLIDQAIKSGVDPKRILYARIDAPIFAGMPLDKYLEFLPKKLNGGTDRFLILFDEIQYLPNWEVHLKDLVDRFANVKFVVSGSAAAALRLRSKESGAGRFSEFMLPPLTFHEFLLFTNHDALMFHKKDHPTERFYFTEDIEALNVLFIKYLNSGGYPESVLNKAIENRFDQFIGNDIVEKVLLKDLPSLYGIDDIQSLNKLFSVLAYNTGNEISLEGISQSGGPSKPTIKKYIEYLESAFLIIKVPRIDENCRSFKTERNFKIYLNNPSMRAALFRPVKETEPEMIGHLTESAIFSQWQHDNALTDMRYARWKNQGEVDMVYIEPGSQKPRWAGEIKWSDRIEGDATSSMQFIIEKHAKDIKTAFITTRTLYKEIELGGMKVGLVPSACYCYSVGRNITESIRDGHRTTPNVPAMSVPEDDLMTSQAELKL
jgi:predicted AAA+ superfamily ATPase